MGQEDKKSQKSFVLTYEWLLCILIHERGWGWGAGVIRKASKGINNWM